MLAGIPTAHLIDDVDPPRLPRTSIEKQAYLSSFVAAHHQDSLSSCIGRMARRLVDVILDVVERFTHATRLCSDAASTFAPRVASRTSVA